VPSRCPAGAQQTLAPSAMKLCATSPPPACHSGAEDTALLTASSVLMPGPGCPEASREAVTTKSIPPGSPRPELSGVASPEPFTAMDPLHEGDGKAGERGGRVLPDVGSGGAMVVLLTIEPSLARNK